MEELIISSRRRMGPNRREFRLNAGVTGLKSQAKIGVDIAALEGRSNNKPAGSTGSGSRGRRARQNVASERANKRGVTKFCGHFQLLILGHC